jgi:hypothetical protein
MCVRAVAGGEDLDDVIPGFSGHKVALVARDVIEVLQAGDLKHSDPPGGDWLRTIVAESRFSEAARLRERRNEAEANAPTAHGQEILEGVAASSDRSPVLFYEDIYFEASQSLLRRSDRRALERHNERIADVLRDPKAPNLMAAMRDLAVVHLKLGDYPEGLAMLSALLRHDPSDPWAFNALAIDLPRLVFPQVASDQLFEVDLDLFPARLVKHLGHAGLVHIRDVDEGAQGEADVLARILAIPGVHQLADAHAATREDGVKVHVVPFH